ncbi:leucine-rich repeat protein lrrA-like [Polypterus senegalus]
MKAARSHLSLLSNGDTNWKYRIERDSREEGKRKLKLQGKELLAVPLNIFDMEELEVLEMTPERESCLTYRMEFVPREIGQLRNLCVLNLDTNELKVIPAEIGLLEKLERLTLSNNFLSFLPKEISRLQKLTSLHMANNHFRELPLQICQLKNLIFLDASDNKIKVIPHHIQNLAKLETLLLFFNRLEMLPDTFCNLRNLRTLWLGKNKIRRLPRRFGDLVKLEWRDEQCSSNFEENPLEHPPIAVCRSGIKGIKNYFSGWRDEEY